MWAENISFEQETWRCIHYMIFLKGLSFQYRWRCYSYFLFDNVLQLDVNASKDPAASIIRYQEWLSYNEDGESSFEILVSRYRVRWCVKLSAKQKSSNEKNPWYCLIHDYFSPSLKKDLRNSFCFYSFWLSISYFSGLHLHVNEVGRISKESDSRNKIAMIEKIHSGQSGRKGSWPGREIRGSH